MFCVRNNATISYIHLLTLLFLISLTSQVLPGSFILTWLITSFKNVWYFAGGSLLSDIKAAPVHFVWFILLIIYCVGIMRQNMKNLNVKHVKIFLLTLFNGKIEQKNIFTTFFLQLWSFSYLLFRQMQQYWKVEN